MMRQLLDLLQVRIQAIKLFLLTTFLPTSWTYITDAGTANNNLGITANTYIPPKSCQQYILAYMDGNSHQQRL